MPSQDRARFLELIWAVTWWDRLTFRAVSAQVRAVALGRGWVPLPGRKQTLNECLPKEKSSSDKDDGPQ